MHKASLIILIAGLCLTSLVLASNGHQHKTHLTQLQNHPVGQLINTWRGIKDKGYQHICIHDIIAANFQPVVEGSTEPNPNNVQPPSSSTSTSSTNVQTTPSVQNSTISNKPNEKN